MTRLLHISMQNRLYLDILQHWLTVFFMSGKPQKRPSEVRLRGLLAKHSITETSSLLGCHRTTVRLWALDYGIIEKQRPYRYKLPSGSKLNQLAKTNTDAELAARFGCTEQTIRTHRHEDGIFRSRVRRRYTLNESFFEKIDTEDKAYVLGLLSADGTISVRSVILMLHSKDQHIIRDVRKAMGSNALIMERRIAKRPDLGPYKLIYFGSQKLVADLAKLGVMPRKSLTMLFPKLPKKLERHYLRGLFDGDGCMRDNSFYFLGTEDVIDGARASILSHTGIQLTKARADKLWTITGCRRSKQVLDWLYKDASIFLKRKHRRFLKHWC